jgi:hypothetical protein
MMMDDVVYQKMHFETIRIDVAREGVNIEDLGM